MRLVQWRSQVAMRQNKTEFKTLRHILVAIPLVRCLHLLSRNNPTKLIEICFLISCHYPLMVVWVMIFQTLHSDIYNTHWEHRIRQKLLEKWKQMDTDLETIIPKVFTQKTINILSTSELSHKFDTWLHSYFLEQFGQKKKNSCEKHTR